MQRDKKLHLIAGFCIAAVAAFALLLLGAPHGLTIPLACLLGAGVAGVAGWAKEYVYDKKRPENHTVDRRDFVVTLQGGILGALVFGLIVAQVKIPGM